MTEPVIAKEQAEVEFDQWVDAMDIDANESEMDQEDLTEYKKVKGRIIRAIMSGSLTFNEDGEAVYKTQNQKSGDQKTVTFFEVDGAALMASDYRKANHNVSKMFAIMTAMCKTNQQVFSVMKGADIKLCIAITKLLMD